MRDYTKEYLKYKEILKSEGVENPTEEQINLRMTDPLTKPFMSTDGEIINPTDTYYKANKQCSIEVYLHTDPITEEESRNCFKNWDKCKEYIDTLYDYNDLKKTLNYMMACSKENQRIIEDIKSTEIYRYDKFRTVVERMEDLNNKMIKLQNEN